MVAVMREKIIEEYHDHLSADESLTAELFARLKGGMSATHMLYGNRELGVSLRPHFLNRRQFDLLTGHSEILVGAFNQVAEAMLENEALMAGVGLSEREKRLALAHPGYALPAINSRLDAFVFGDEVKFVEYNAENPSSLTDQAGLNQILFEIRAMQLVSERYRMRQFTPIASVRQSLLTTYREWGGIGAPNIAILDWANLPTEHEFLLLRNYFVGHGIPTVICTPDELDYSGGKLRRGDFRIDLVYKRIVIHEFLSHYDDAHPLVRAYLNREVCLVNPFRCKLLHKKATFELLTDEASQSWFTPQEQQTIKLCVPWTRRVLERKTFYRDRQVDLIEHIRRQRADFVLKPNDRYGGHGICFGNRASEAEWDAAISTALAGDYVAQERLDLQTEIFPIFDEQEWSLQPMFVDTNPFIFRGAVDGAMVRLSDSPIVNVTSGGGETGFFVIEE
jgi:hypothetical protein